MNKDLTILLLISNIFLIISRIKTVAVWMRSRGTYNENLAGFPEIDYLGYQGYSSPIVSLSTGRKDN